jgi:hypothetical protein
MEAGNEACSKHQTIPRECKTEKNGICLYFPCFVFCFSNVLLLNSFLFNATRFHSNWKMKFAQNAKMFHTKTKHGKVHFDSTLCVFAFVCSSCLTVKSVFVDEESLHQTENQNLLKVKGNSIKIQNMKNVISLSSLCLFVFSCSNVWLLSPFLFNTQLVLLSWKLKFA